jgi:hypothetical protein
LSGDFSGERKDFVVKARPSRQSPGLLYSLYAFEALRVLERELDCNCSQPELKSKIVALSISSVVLCRHTAFVGVSEESYGTECEEEEEGEEASDGCFCEGMDGGSRIFCSFSDALLMAPSGAWDDRSYHARPRLCEAEFSPFSRPPPQQQRKVEGDVLMRIIGSQHIDGWWAHVRALLEMAGKEIHVLMSSGR